MNERIVEVPETVFEGFLNREAYSLFRSFAAYEGWHQAMGILRVFWASGGERLGLVGVYMDGEPVAVARVLRVPFYERKRWGEQARERGEIQDILLAFPEEHILARLIEAAETLLQKHGITAFGVSSWIPEQWPLLERIGLRPYARSVLLGWATDRPLRKSGHPKVVVRPATSRERSLLRRIQESSWGFFIPPDFAQQEVLIAWIGDTPVGSVYLNRSTCNLDFGVHVVRERWRQRVGTALLEAARRRCLAWGAARMTVVRVLRALTHINPADRRAWCFYRVCGGELLREVRGFRRKKRPRPLPIPGLPTCGSVS